MYVSSPDSMSPILNADDWHFVLVASTNINSKMVHTQRLRQNFSRNEPLNLMVKMNCDDFSTDVVFFAKLISFVGDGKYRPCLKLGKVKLNALSFLEPEDSLMLYSPHQMSFDDQLKRVLSDNTLKNDVNPIKMRVEIPLEGADKLAEKILTRSQSLWRSSCWSEALSSDNFSVVIRGSKIKLKFSSGVLHLESDDVKALILMKYAVVNLLSPKFKIKGLNEQLLLECEVVPEMTIMKLVNTRRSTLDRESRAFAVEDEDLISRFACSSLDLLKILETIEFSSENPNFSDIFKIYTRKIKFITDVLSGTTTNIS